MNALLIPENRKDANGRVDDGTPGSFRIPRSAHTLNGFRAWVLSDEFPEKLKATYLRGDVILDLSKEEIRTHAAVKTAVVVPVANLIEELDFGDLYINGVLVTNAAAAVSNNPDAVAVSWASLEAGRVRYVTRKGRDLEMEGSPDWVREIVSDSSVWKDTQELVEAYHRARIAEYWLVDARGDDIDFRILHWRKQRYAAATGNDGWLYSRVFERWFRLTRKRDRRGAWKYVLHVRA